MSLFNSLPSKPPGERTVRQLRLLAEQCQVIEVQPIDPEGQVEEGGKSRVLEYRDAEHQLVVEVPSKQGELLPLGAGRPVRLHMELKGALYRAETEVLERFLLKTGPTSTLPALVLRGPSTIESGNRRQHFRVEPMIRMKLPTKWRPAIADKSKPNPIHWQATEMRDISCRGLSFWVSKLFGERIRNGHRLEILLQIPGQAQPFECQALVRRITPPQDATERYLLGVEFDLPDDSIREVQGIANYVAECEREIARARRDKE